MFSVENPDRLVIDLDDVELDATLNGLSGKIDSNDPYIKSVRVGRFKPGTVRLVLDLKGQVKPQLFDLDPVSEYGYRLVLDVYPATAPDPLMALLKEDKTPPVAAPLAGKPADNIATPLISPPPVLKTLPELRAQNTDHRN